uniref:Uncharacterized protein n=1 Tax=Florenciella parvula TaxID=236787 RepID=A0A7S2CE64_9STRA
MTTAAARGVPMLVTNPDLVRPGSMAPMPGRLGKLYAGELGGEVTYIGKPHNGANTNGVYDRALAILAEQGVSDLDRVCMVGDAMETDIRGAALNGLGGSVLIGHGIHSESLGLEQGKGAGETMDQGRLEELLEGYDDEERPTHAIPAFNW